MQTILAVGLPLQLQTLVLSPQNKLIKNPDEATSSRWPQIVFWMEGLVLMDQVEIIEDRIFSLDVNVQDKFWQGSIPAQFLEEVPWLAKFNPAQVVEYCRIRQSRSKAADHLIIQARGERLCQKGAYSKVSMGEVRLVEEKFLLNAAVKSKSVKRYYLPQFIFEAAQQNNVRFFIRLGKALQSRAKVPDVDWSRCDPVACFLVQNWCGWLEYDRLFPALCFLSDQALADFCSAVFGKKPGIPSIDSIRQWRRRLGLKQARSPKIRQFSLKGNEALFVG